MMSDSEKQYRFISPLGPLYLVASESALTGLFWKQQAIRFVACASECSILYRATQQLHEYFSGSRNEFNVPLDPRGTEFQKAVWGALALVPFGTTASYKDIAIRLQKKNGARAVGLANARNPICLFIPCHRVIGSSGNLTGYVGGLNNKISLLELERRSDRR
jgi:methylated-DNA-[protein]-cysteine S-methyltransferase